MFKLFKPKSQFGRNILVSSRANFIALTLPLLITPILTRLYTSDEFAALAIFTSILSIMAALGSWKLDWHIPNTNSMQEAISLFLISIFLSGVMSLGIFFFLREDTTIFNFWEGWIVIKPYIKWMPVALVGITLSSLLRALYIKKADLFLPSKTRIYEVFSNSLLQMFFGILKKGTSGLIFSRIISIWIGALMLLMYSRHFFPKIKNLSVRRVYVSWLIHYKEASFSTAVSIVNIISLGILPLLLIQYYSAVEVGWFTLMLRLAITPVSVITSAVSQSFWAEAATLIKGDKEKLYRLYIINTKRLILLAVPIIVFCLLGPYYVTWVLGGDNWSGAGYVLAALTPMIAGQVIFSPLSHLIIHNKQHWQLIWDGIRFLLLVGVTVIFHNTISMIELVWLISSISFLMYVILFYLNKINFGVN